MRLKNILCTFLLLATLGCQARTYVYGITTGGPTISPSSTSPSLQGGDTLLVPGAYYQLNFNGLKGTPAKRIYIVGLPGQIITSSAAFTAGEWTGCEFVTVLNINSRNNMAPVQWFRNACHDITFDGCSYVNDRGKYSTQQAFLFDDKSSGAMNFDGTKATTFYNMRITNCQFNGFQGVNAIECGSEGARSVCTDFFVENNIFRNITTYGAVVPGCVGGTIFNFQCHYNRFDSILVDVGAYQKVHASVLTGYGNGDIGFNYFSSMYAGPVRWNPLTWKGLPGYTGPLTVHDNLVYDLKSYDAFEINNNNSGPRIKALGCDTAATDVYLNTVVRTTRMSYNGDYHGFIVGLLAHKVRVRYNVIVDPEHGTTYDPKTRLGYAVAFISGNQPGFDSIGNRSYATPAAAGLDIGTWQLSPTSPLVDVVAPVLSKTDIDGTIRPQGPATDLGAIERKASAPPAKHVINVCTNIISGLLVVSINWSDGSTSSYQ